MTEDPKAAEHLAMLQRRAEHLGRRIIERPHAFYDKQERDALIWAIGRLTPSRATPKDDDDRGNRV